MSAVVLIPAYNAAGTIAATLKSLQAQGPALDRLTGVYVADDSSTDDTVSVAAETWSVSPPLKILCSDRNLGQHANVNRAFDALQPVSDWVILLHADDLVKPAWLGTMLDEIASSGQRTASICTSWDNLSPDGTVQPGQDEPRRGTQHIAGSARTVRDTLLKGCWWHISGCAIRMKAFADVGRFEPAFPYMADWDWLLRCLSRGWTISYVPRTLMYYRLHPASVAALSFQIDRDITESLDIARRYAPALSERDVVAFHVRRAIFALRRSARAAQQGRLPRTVGELKILGLIWRNLATCLRARRPQSILSVGT